MLSVCLVCVCMSPYIYIYMYNMCVCVYIPPPCIVNYHRHHSQAQPLRSIPSRYARMSVLSSPVPPSLFSNPPFLPALIPFFASVIPSFASFLRFLPSFRAQRPLLNLPSFLPSLFSNPFFPSLGMMMTTMAATTMEGDDRRW